MNCTKCGRSDVYWDDREPGNKRKMHVSDEDRTVQYRKWRRGLKSNCYVTDIDQLEWTIVDGVAVPLAVLEISRVDGAANLPPSYFDAVITRITKRDAQRKFATTAARLLGCKAWFVLFRADGKEFWVYNLTDGTGWFHMHQKAYREWLEGLRDAV